MSVSLGIVMDPIESIVPYKDTTLAMMLAAQHRGWTVHIIMQEDIFLHMGQVHAARRKVQVYDDNDHWFDAEPLHDAPLSSHDIILMRKDPPFNMNYIYTTYLLERAAIEGTLVNNRPSSLRDVNEKLYTAWFSEHCPPTLVTTSADRLKQFVIEHEDAIVKPLDGMGGESIYRLTPNDPNINVVLEHMTQRNKLQIMAQRYIPEIRDGDKRVLVVNGKPVSHALARVPAQGETRGNLAAGGRGVPQPLNDHDRQLAESLGPHLVEKGLLFVGLDIIGTMLTEINVTSPTCVRELDAHNAGNNGPAGSNGYQAGIADTYLDALAAEHDAQS